MEIEVLLETTARALACLAYSDVGDNTERQKELKKDRENLRAYKSSLYELEDDEIDTQEGIKYLNSILEKYDRYTKEEIDNTHDKMDIIEKIEAVSSKIKSHKAFVINEQVRIEDELEQGKLNERQVKEQKEALNKTWGDLETIDRDFFKEAKDKKDLDIDFYYAQIDDVFSKYENHFV